MSGFEVAEFGGSVEVLLKSGTTGRVVGLSSWTERLPEAGDVVLIESSDENGMPFDEKGIIEEVLAVND